MVLCICRFPVRFVGRSTMQNQCQICTAGMKSVSMTSLRTETEGLFCISGWHQPSSDFVVCVSHAVKEWHNVLAIRHTILVCKIVVEGLWCVCVFFVCLFLSFSLCSNYRLLCKRSDCTVFPTAAYAKFAPTLSLFP